MKNIQDISIDVRTPIVKTRCRGIPILAKREDKLTYAGGVCGTKLRGVLRLLWNFYTRYNKAPTALVTPTARNSPQMQIVAAVAKHHGLACRCHTASGTPTTEMEFAKHLGAEIIQHRPGYTSVIKKRAEDDTEQGKELLIPFALETLAAVKAVEEEASRLLAQVMACGYGLPERILVPVGGGITLAGVLYAMATQTKGEGIWNIPVVGVTVGASPGSRLDKYGPPMWRKRVRLHAASGHYTEGADATLSDIGYLDPHYEAKAMQFVKPGDLFWLAGKRVEKW